MNTDRDGLVVIGKMDMRLSGGPLSPMIYIREVRHRGLSKSRTFRHKDQDVLVERINDQIDRWNKEYTRLVQRAAAEEATQDVQEQLRDSEEILSGALQTEKREPSRPGQALFHDQRQADGIKYDPMTGEPLFYWPADRPKGDAPTYRPPPVTWLDRRLPFLWRHRETAALDAFEHALEDWEAAHEKADHIDSIREQTLDSEEQGWRSRESRRLRYAQGDHQDSWPIEHHAELILNASEYPDWIEDELDFDLRYTPDSRSLVVEFQLPEQESMPTLRQVTYVQTKDEFRENHIPVRERERLYGSVLCQIALRTMYELYAADEVYAIDSIVFNGWIEAVDASTGREAERYIMSIRSRRDEFLTLNLADVEPEACFRSLESIAGRKLAALEEVEPIERLDPEGS